MQASHKTKLFHWILKSYDAFPHRKAEKVELGSTFFGTERNGQFSIHVTHAHAHELLLLRSVPVRGKFSASGKPPLYF